MRAPYFNDLKNQNKLIISQAKEITLLELTDSLESMKSGKTPGNDGLTVEFYKQFWEKVVTNSNDE